MVYVVVVQLNLDVQVRWEYICPSSFNALHHALEILPLAWLLKIDNLRKGEICDSDLLVDFGFFFCVAVLCLPVDQDAAVCLYGLEYFFAFIKIFLDGFGLCGHCKLYGIFCVLFGLCGLFFDDILRLCGLCRLCEFCGVFFDDNCLTFCSLCDLTNRSWKKPRLAFLHCDIGLGP